MLQIHLKAHRVLHTHLVLDGLQGRGRVQRPVTQSRFRWQSWYNMQMNTMMSKRPFTSSALILALSCPEPPDVSTLNTVFMNLLPMDVDP